MSNGITMLQGLPHNVPFIPQVQVRDNLSQQLRRITGELMAYMQQQAYANSLVQALYQLVGQNTFNNPAFTQLAQDTVIILDYIMSNTNPPPQIDSLLREYIPIICLGASASYAIRTPQVLQSLNNPNLQLTAGQTSDQYNQLINTAKNWFQGANMTQYHPQVAYQMAPQGFPTQGYGQMPYAPQMMPPQMPYGAPAMAVQGYGGMPAYGNPAMMAQRPMLNPNQMMGNQPGYPQQQFVPQNNGPYVPQVAGGLFNPNMVAQPGYTAPPAYGFTEPSTGPRSGGLGSAIPGMNPQPPVTQEQQNYVPQPAGAAVNPAYMNQPNLGAPANIGQNLPHQAAPATYQAPAQQHHPAPAPVPMAPPPIVNQQIPATAQTNDTTPTMEATENTPYRIPNGTSYTRLPFMYDYTTEKHVVRMNSNGEVVYQQVINKDDAVNLSDHDTTPYFIARTKQDLVSPNLKTFTDALDRAATEITATQIMEQLANLQDKSEEEISKETAVILRDNLSTKLLVINDCFIASSNYKVNYHEQFKNTVAAPIAAKVNDIAATFRSVSPRSWWMTGETAKLASLITLSEGLFDLHRHFCKLVDQMIGPNASPLVDDVTDFVNLEIRRFFGLKYTMTSFCTDMMDLIEIISEDETIEFAGVVSEHIHQRLTSTILYAYTPAELNETCRAQRFEDEDARIYARVDQIVVLPVRSRDVPYTYNGKAGLILATEYQSLNRLIKNCFDMGGQHMAELKLVTLDGDVIHVHPIVNDNSYVMFKSEANRQD